MEKFLKIYGIILLSLLSVALAGLLIAGIVFMAPSLSDSSSGGVLAGLGNGIVYALGVFAFAMCVEVLALAIPFFFRFAQARKKRFAAVRIIDVFMVAYYSVAIVAGIIWSIADKDSLTFGIILLSVALILNTFAIPALVWDKKQKAAENENTVAPATEMSEEETEETPEETEEEVIYKEI